MREIFTSSGYDYALKTIKGNEIVFYLESGLGDGSENDLLTDEFGYSASATRTVNVIKNPVAVFREVRRLVLDYVLGNNVSHFCFRGSSDRIEIFRKFADSLNRYGYRYSFHEGCFTFYHMIES